MTYWQPAASGQARASLAAASFHPRTLFGMLRGPSIHPGTSIIGRALLCRPPPWLQCPPFLDLRRSISHGGAYRPSLRPVDQKIGISLHFTSGFEPSSHVRDLLHDLLHGRAVADKVLGFSTFEYEAVHQCPCVGDGEANFEGRFVGSKRSRGRCAKDLRGRDGDAYNAGA
jgi:hypothetical protein